MKLSAIAVACAAAVMPAATIADPEMAGRPVTGRLLIAGTAPNIRWPLPRPAGLRLPAADRWG